MTSRQLLYILLVFSWTSSSCQPPIVKPGEYVYLKMDHKRQPSMLCVPTSAAIVLGYYGEDVKPEVLKQLSTPPNSSYPGTYLSDLIRGVKSLGYEWEERVFEGDSISFEEGFNEIRQRLDAGTPVLVSTAHPPIGHTMVMVGYDVKRETIFLVDPDIEAPGRRSLTYRQFKDIWHEEFDERRAFVATRPKRSQKK